MSRSERPFHELAAAKLARFFAGLPASARRRFKAPSTYVTEVERLYTRARRNQSPAAADPDSFVDDYIRHITLRTLFDRNDPTGIGVLLSQAIDIAEEILGKRDRRFRAEYGDGVADLGASHSIAWFGLVELGRAMNRGTKVDNPVGYLRTIINGEIRRMIDRAIGSISPARRARYHLFLRLLKQLEQERPELTEADRRELAAKLADEAMRKLGHFVDQILDPEASEQIPDLTDPYQAAIDDALVQLIEDILQAPPEARSPRFTDVDRETWRLYKAAGFVGRDIDWPTACGISRHAGSQRLHTLLRKLRDALGDGWDVD